CARSDHRTNSGLSRRRECEGDSEHARSSEKADRWHPRYGDRDSHAARWRHWRVCSTSGIVKYHMESGAKAGSGPVETAQRSLYFALGGVGDGIFTVDL